MDTAGLFERERESESWIDVKECLMTLRPIDYPFNCKQKSFMNIFDHL